MCKSICSPAPQPLCDFQSDAKSELRLEDAKYGLGQGFVCLPMRWIWDKSKVFATHSCCIMCKSICSPAPQPLCDFQSDAKSELRLEDAKYGLGQGFLCLPLRWIWDKSRVCATHSCCIMCKSIHSPAPQPIMQNLKPDLEIQIKHPVRYTFCYHFGCHLPQVINVNLYIHWMVCNSTFKYVIQYNCYTINAKSEAWLGDTKQTPVQVYFLLSFRLSFTSSDKRQFVYSLNGMQFNSWIRASTLPINRNRHISLEFWNFQKIVRLHCTNQDIPDPTLIDSVLNSWYWSRGERSWLRWDFKLVLITR